MTDSVHRSGSALDAFLRYSHAREAFLLRSYKTSCYSETGESYGTARPVQSFSRWSRRTTEILEARGTPWGTNCE